MLKLFDEGVQCLYFVFSFVTTDLMSNSAFTAGVKEGNVGVIAMIEISVMFEQIGEGFGFTISAGSHGLLHLFDSQLLE